MALDSLHEWINNGFLEKALNSGEEKKLKVLSWKIERAISSEEITASYIYRVILKISRNGVQDNKSVIVKIEPCLGDVGKITDRENLFQREIDVYVIAIQNAMKLLKDSSKGKYQYIAPKCYYTYSGPPASVIVMEDLEESGFRLAKHSAGLDINHCFLAMNTLASYHAASVVLYAKDPKKIEPFKASLYTEEMKSNFKKLLEPTLRRLAFEAQTWPQCKGEIAVKLHELAYFDSFDKLINSAETDEKDFNVLAHEDAWLNNIMFRYSGNSEKPDDVRYIDFQFSHWTSPVIDLSYFINANASLDIVLEPQIIIEEYYKKLRLSLRALGHGHLCPSKQYLYDQYDKRCKFGIILGLVVRSYILKYDNKMDETRGECRSQKWSNFSETYRNDVKKMLPYFLKRGWI